MGDFFEFSITFVIFFRHLQIVESIFLYEHTIKTLDIYLGAWKYAFIIFMSNIFLSTNFVMEVCVKFLASLLNEEE